jgi:hypothetical protein
MVWMKAFDGTYVLGELGKLDRTLKRKFPIYVLGGAAMSFYGMKTATKDIDVVVESKNDLAELSAALEASGYSRPARIDAPYRAMRAGAILENRDGFRWDIFVKTVCGGLSLSPGIAKRAKDFGNFTNVCIKNVSPEDIFIFKAVTSRPRDRDDMFVLFSNGLDFNEIKHEINGQSKASNDKAWVAFFFVGLDEMVEKYGTMIPNYDEFLEMAEKDALEKLAAQKTPKNIDK